LMKKSALASRNWMGEIDPLAFMNLRSPQEAAALKWKYWLRGEPELTLRISRQVLANRLPEIDKPLPLRRKMADSSLVLLFDRDPAAPRLRGQLDPADIDRAIAGLTPDRELMRRETAFDITWLRQAARQAAIEALLAAQTYRRDHGELPERLSQLVPDYLDAMPVDPSIRRENHFGIAVTNRPRRSPGARAPTELMGKEISCMSPMTQQQMSDSS
jgi:hypothetical protein